MHYGRIASLAAAALTAVVALGTVPIRAAEPAVVELLGMFITICLERFPDDDAVKQFANEKRLEAMTEEHTCLARIRARDGSITPRKADMC
jgi:hypothetical protein